MLTYRCGIPLVALSCNHRWTQTDSGVLPMRLFARRPVQTFPEAFELATDAGVIAVALRRNPRARNYTLRVGGPTLPPTLTIPPRGSLSGARRFLDRHSAWLRRQVARVPEATAIADGATLPIRGVPHLVRHEPYRRWTGTSAAEERAVLAVSGEALHLPRRVVDYLKREAKRDLDAAVLRHAAALGVKPTQIRIRDQRTRWGSCSHDGHLSFSWRLIMAPPFVLDYLAAHEVAHLIEHNHSRRFWRLVEKLCPDRHHARAWLRLEGATLHAIGAG
jgi:predicted metal-dependent hydrolase